MHLFKYESKIGMPSSQDLFLHPYDLTTTGGDASPPQATSELGNGHASNSDRSPSPNLIRTTERRLLLKIDCRVIPCLAILSLLCFLNLLDMMHL